MSRLILFQALLEHHKPLLHCAEVIYTKPNLKMNNYKYLDHQVIFQIRWSQAWGNLVTSAYNVQWKDGANTTAHRTKDERFEIPMRRIENVQGMRMKNEEGKCKSKSLRMMIANSYNSHTKGFGEMSLAGCLIVAFLLRWKILDEG